MSYVTVLDGWLQGCGCGRFGASHSRQEHLTLAAQERAAASLATEADQPYGLEVLVPDANGQRRAAVVHEETGERMAVFHGDLALQDATSEMLRLNANPPVDIPTSRA
jgi:hypothetical protein